MDYTESKALGDRGEAITSTILGRRKAPEALVLNDLLFDGVDTTTQVDHILIDRFGLLLVETKSYAALMRGTSDDRTWTACYKGGARRQMPNPLRQNEGHRDKLLRTLQQHGFRLDRTYTQSVVVFAQGDVSGLQLTSEDRARVLSAEEFEQHLATRQDFAPNAGDLSPEQLRTIAGLVLTLDRSTDEEVAARHALMVRGASKRSPRSPRRATRRPVPPPVHPGIPRKPVTQRRGERERDSALFRLVLLVVLCAFLALGSRIGGVLSFAPVQPAQPAAPVVQPAAPAPSAADALALLREVDPGTAKALVDPAHPVLSNVNGYATYTWQYARKNGAQSVSIGTVSISLDTSGRIVGSTRK